MNDAKYELLIAFVLSIVFFVFIQIALIKIIDSFFPDTYVGTMNSEILPSDFKLVGIETDEQGDVALLQSNMGMTLLREGESMYNIHFLEISNFKMICEYKGQKYVLNLKHW